MLGNMFANFPGSSLGSKDGILEQGFWNDRELFDPKDPGALRILVCGNAGVGKSSLINEVFGVEVTQSSDRQRGIHNIKDEITLPGRPDLIIHDSGGFEAGSVDEFEAVESFLKEKSAQTDIDKRLHLIWYVPISSQLS
jgi:predicted GTPase